MKGAEPALAELRANQIGTDISRGTEYGAQARGYKSNYEELENILAEAIRSRLYQSGILGASAEQEGLTRGSETLMGGSQTARSQSGLNELYGRRETEAQANKNAYDSAMISMLDKIVSGLGGVGTGTPTTGTKGGSVDLAKILAKSQQKSAPQGNLTVGGTPYENQKTLRLFDILKNR